MHQSARLLLYCGHSRGIPDGERITACHVLLAVGFPYFRHIPSEYAQMLPPGTFTHTCDMVSFDAFQGQRGLIVGGRQRAFEWVVVLLHNHGAAAVHVLRRYVTPK